MCFAQSASNLKQLKKSEFIGFDKTFMMNISEKKSGYGLEKNYQFFQFFCEINSRVTVKILSGKLLINVRYFHILSSQGNSCNRT